MSGHWGWCTRFSAKAHQNKINSLAASWILQKHLFTTGSHSGGTVDDASSRKSKRAVSGSSNAATITGAQLALSAGGAV